MSIDSQPMSCHASFSNGELADLEVFDTEDDGVFVRLESHQGWSLAATISKRTADDLAKQLKKAAKKKADR